MSHSRIAGRTLARSQALQLLFQAEATSRTIDDVLAGDYALSQGPLDPYADQLARGTYQMLGRLDHILSRYSADWDVSRMPAADRNLLRIALYEMLFVEDVAIAVSIDECVVLAKAYGTDESSRFVNGILGAIADDIEAGNLSLWQR